MDRLIQPPFFLLVCGGKKANNSISQTPYNTDTSVI